jgi:asparagine synthase (glutamine-hydrolysing)
MCGICGFYSKSISKSDEIIKKMSLSIYHRGPDDSGIWQDHNEGIVFGHQRLAIIDPSPAGKQPMQSSSGRFVITYNGEIYNHLQIKNEIEETNLNINWRGNSDTETLLEAISFWGIEVALQKIDGMFAFALWDKKKRSLMLARDRIGEKPLYYGWQGDGINKVFLFGSELKALKAHPKFKGEINRDAITLQLRHNYIPAPYSIYKDIFKLLPGHYLTLSENDLNNHSLLTSKAYWSLVKCATSGNSNQLIHNEKDIEIDLEKILKLSVKKQMISDVPIGAFLSAGVDSSTIVALMQSQSRSPVNTFTIGFNESEYDEAKYAKKIAKHLGTNHTELYISPKEAMEVIPKLANIYDEPFSDSSQIPTFLISQLAKQNVKVALSGDGGDELFCGYNRYLVSKKSWNLLRLMPLFSRKILSSLIQAISPQKWNQISKILPSFFLQYANFGDKIHKGANVLKAETINQLYYMLTSHWQNPTEVALRSNEPGTFLTEFKPHLKSLNSQEQMMVLDFISYLPDDILVKVDRAAMATSLETRAPFLDHKLIEYVWKIPQSYKLRKGQGKWILRKILNKYVPKNLTQRPKMGFGVPIESWLRDPLRDWAENLLDEKRLRQEGYFNAKEIRNKWNQHLSGKVNWHYHIWDILMFQSWIDKSR